MEPIHLTPSTFTLGLIKHFESSGVNNAIVPFDSESFCIRIFATDNDEVIHMRLADAIERKCVYTLTPEQVTELFLISDAKAIYHYLWEVSNGR